jgi:hypothetical protein
MTRTSSWFQPLRNTENKQLGSAHPSLKPPVLRMAVSVPMVLDSHSQAILGVPRHGCIWVCPEYGRTKIATLMAKMTINHPDLRCPLFWGKATCLPTVMAPPLCLTFAQQVKPGVFKEKLMPLKWRGLGVNWVKPHFRRW